MNTNLGIGFYSVRIVKIYFIVTILLFMGYSYYTFNQFFMNCKQLVMQQTTMFIDEWNSKVDNFSYVLKNDFLPSITESLEKHPINEQDFLLKIFKQRLGYSPAIEDIILLDHNYRIVGGYNGTRCNNFSFYSGDKEFLKISASNPGEVKYGEWVINNNYKTSLPIAIAIHDFNKDGLYSGIKGYLIININLENLSRDFMTHRLFSPLEKITFLDANLPEHKYTISQKRIEQKTIYYFFHLLLEAFNYPYAIVELDQNYHGKTNIFFVYNVHKVAIELCQIYITHMAIPIIAILAIILIFRSYKRNVLDPISNCYAMFQNIQNKYNILSAHEISFLEPNRDYITRSEIGNLSQLHKFGHLIMDKLESNDLATKLASEYNEIALEDLNIKSSNITESVEDLIYEYKNNSNLALSDKLAFNINNLYKIASTTTFIIDTYKRIAKEILPIITRGKTYINLATILKQAIQKSCIDPNRIFILPNQNSRIYKIKLYKTALEKTIHKILQYLIESYLVPNRVIEIDIDYQPKEGIIINFLVKLNAEDNIIIKDSILDSILEEAKIYSLFNCSIFTEEFGSQFYKISLLFGDAIKGKNEKIINLPELSPGY